MPIVKRLGSDGRPDRGGGVPRVGRNSKVGLVHGEEGILWGKPRLVAKVEPKCDLGSGSARALFHLSLIPHAKN